MMKKLWLMAAALMLFSQAALAEQWEAKCTDGKNLHYLQTINGDGFMYMTVTLPTNEQRVFPFAKVRQTLFNGEAVCGQLSGGLQTRAKTPVTQFCANRRSGLIYMKHQDPLQRNPLVSGKFCDAEIIIR